MTRRSLGDHLRSLRDSAHQHYQQEVLSLAAAQQQPCSTARVTAPVGPREVLLEVGGEKTAAQLVEEAAQKFGIRCKV